MTTKKKKTPPPLPAAIEPPPDAAPLEPPAPEDAATVAAVAAGLEAAAPASLEGAIASFSLARKTRVRVSAVLAAGLEELAAEAEKNGHPGVIDSEGFRGRVVAPLFQAIAGDLQGLGVVTLEEAIEVLAVAWTSPPPSDD